MEKYYHLAYDLDRQALLNSIAYYESNYLPQMAEYGYGQQQYIQMLHEKLNELESDCKLKMYKPRTSVLANAIRAEAQYYYDVAETSNNKIYWLRKVIQHLNDLKKLVPELRIYSNKWLAQRRYIKLNIN